MPFLTKDRGVYFGAVIPYAEEKQAMVVLLSVPHTPCGIRDRMQIPASTVPEITQKPGRNDGSPARKG